MRIALYHPWVYLKGGIEREMLELILRSRHQWVIFTNHYEPRSTFEGYQNIQVIELKRIGVQRDMATVLKAALFLLRQKLPLEGFDALLVQCDGLGNFVTFRNRQQPTYCLCSTPLRPVYDNVYAKVARTRRGLMGRFLFSFFQTVFRTVDRLAWKNYRSVVAISGEVKRRIVENQLFPGDERLQVFYPGIDPADAPAQVFYEPFLLVPGRIMWTKNIDLAIDAFRLAQLPAPWRLVIAGFVDKKSRIYLQALRERAAGIRVEFVVSPSDQELNDLYLHTSAVLFPPLNEDWGIVPLEGMLRSKPVVANASGGPIESVVDGKTGWLLEPEPAAWAAVLKTFPDRPEMLAAFGREARREVERFDWQHYARGIDDMLSGCAGEPARAEYNASRAEATPS